MDTFVDLSWYYARFTAPRASTPTVPEEVDYWMNVDQYIGGIEQAIEPGREMGEWHIEGIRCEGEHLGRHVDAAVSGKGGIGNKGARRWRPVDQRQAVLFLKLQ